MYGVYVKQSAVQSAELHFSELAQRNLEGMGLLLGEVCEHKGREFVVIGEFATVESSATAVSVRFSPSAFGSLAQLLKTKLDSARVVGWCHSHPGYGCFLSSTDLTTQQRFFNENYHVAAVFDPKRREVFSQVPAMAKRFYQLHGNGYREVSFAVFK